MKTRTVYVCEICETEYDQEEEARACEALGLPEPMPFLTLGERLPAFGEDGVHWGEIISVSVGDDHDWRVRTRQYMFVSHNVDEWRMPARAFDPRDGVDAFRYACTPDDLRIWEETMRRYGFAESEATDWVIERVSKARARAAKDMARLLED